jgi:hypothetical protein
MLKLIFMMAAHSDHPGLREWLKTPWSHAPVSNTMHEYRSSLFCLCKQACISSFRLPFQIDGKHLHRRRDPRPDGRPEQRDRIRDRVRADQLVAHQRPHVAAGLWASTKMASRPRGRPRRIGKQARSKMAH